ncbi:hypothetical protein C8Q72DRAFT_590728 [Fomitopsis betulina]|nr:hypothetical protein C8Q72DRAFT_590728 [Fomitopsis betulina]
MSDYEAVKNATVRFWQNASDPKANIIVGFTATQNQTFVEVDLFYNGPSPLAELFDDFVTISNSAQNMSAMTVRSYLSIMQSANTNLSAGLRGYFDAVSITDISPTFFDATLNETNFWYQKLVDVVLDLIVHYDVEPFLQSAYSQAAADSSAWPPRCNHHDHLSSPLSIYLCLLTESGCRCEDQ